MTQSRRVQDHKGLVVRTLRAAALAGGITLSFGQTASAQFAFDDVVLPPRVIAWRLADRGFSGLSRPRYDGRIYVVEAINPAGVPVRLFVDRAGGAIVGRQRLGGPETYGRQDYARLERPAPGYGWTEEAFGPRRAVRPFPADEVPASPSRPARRPGTEAARPEANPDGNAHPQPPRKVARAVAPAQPKPALRTTPEAPVPSLAPVEAAKPDKKPEPPAASVDKAPPADAQNKAAVGEGARAEAPKAAAPDWRDPPAESKRPVRVIEGATVVPGPSETKDPAP